MNLPAQKVELVFGSELPTRANLEALCREAIRAHYHAVSVPSSALLFVHHMLDDSDIKVCCRVGFPNGASDSDAKRYETELAIDAGAHEIQIVPSLARIEEGDYATVLRELRDIAEAADERPVKVSCEPGLWEIEALREFAQVVLDSGAQYLCTSEHPEAEPLEEARVLREIVGPDFGIVAAVRTLANANELLSTGANRLALRGQIPSAMLTGVS